MPDQPQKQMQERFREDILEEKERTMKQKLIVITADGLVGEYV